MELGLEQFICATNDSYGERVSILVLMELGFELEEILVDELGIEMFLSLF